MGTFRPWRVTSRIEIAAATGLSAATVSRITRTLVRGGVLTEAALARATAGRPTQGLALDDRQATVLGISLLAPTAHMLVVRLGGEVVDDTPIALDLTRGEAGIVEPLRKAVQGLLRKWPAHVPRAVRVGLALPGQWRRADGVSLQYPHVPEWKTVPVRQMFEQWTGLPVSVIGYAPALALAEQAARGDRAPANLLSVEVADHIAMGILANGVTLEGGSGNAGELGHILGELAGPVCYCGSRGCLETLTTCTAVEADVRNSEIARRIFPDADKVRYEDVIRHARGGDPFAARLLARVARMLGLGLASALNLLNPDLLVVSGRLFDAGDLVLAPLRASILEQTLPSATARLAIETSTLNAHAPALGAAALATTDLIRTL